MKIEAFNYSDVRLFSSLFKTRFDTNRNYLLSLDADSLLFPYRSEAALAHWSYPRARPLDNVSPSLHGRIVFWESFPKDYSCGPPFGGWEHPTSDIRGHFLGH